MMAEVRQQDGEEDSRGEYDWGRRWPLLSPLPGSRCCGSVAVVRAAAVLQRGQHSSQETKTFKNMGHGLHTSSAPLQGHDHVAEHQGK
ncbi:hypothetical protein O3P69_012324 [Scylla paramamosain]|uniref:Uncharacterized protein n=1 Tax=Scylla paramamosain TaxID=85552 RepID=A0AAW0SCZ4_SCYPA